MSTLALFNGSYIGPKPTGIGVVAKELSSALNPGIIKFLNPLGSYKNESIVIPADLNPCYGRKGHIRRLIWTQQKVPSLMKKYEAKFFLSPLPEAPLFKGVKSIVIAHDLLPLRYPQPTPLLAYHLLYVPIILHRAQCILCNSEATSREINCRLGIPIKNLVKIPLGFNPKNLKPLKLVREPFFLVLGRHDPHKNIQMILKSLKILPFKDMQVWFVGPQDSRYTPKLRKLSIELEIEHRCKWIPWVTDEERLMLLNRCQSLIIPSLWEGFGLPALEAMACDTPVIASNKGALPEVVDNAGVFCNPMDSRSIADAMGQIISDGLLRDKLVVNGRKRINKFTWKKCAQQVESVLNQLS